MGQDVFVLFGPSMCQKVIGVIDICCPVLRYMLV